MTGAKIDADVTVRAWEANLLNEGARFKATTVRRDVTFQARIGNSLEVDTVTVPGLVVIAPSAAPTGQNAVDVTVRGIPQHVRFTILKTDEMIWAPVSANLDVLGNWHIETVPLSEWARVILRHDPDLKAAQDGPR